MELSDNLCLNCQKTAVLEQNYRDFISKLSHEVRNPLTLIYSSLQLLEKDCPEITCNILWPQIKFDITSTIQLLRDVSSLNRRKQLRYSSLSTPDFLGSIAASFSALMKNRQITFTFECTPSASRSVICGDETLLREALTNLLINASDAISTAGEIRLYADTDAHHILICVRDNGCGIPDEYLDTLFDPFVTHKPNGTGLGLNIVKTIARQHGGSVTVRTDTDPAHSFTEFCLHLPLCRS